MSCWGILFGAFLTGDVGAGAIAKGLGVPNVKVLIGFFRLDNHITTVFRLY